MDAFDLYNQMEQDKVLLAFKGSITSELLTSVLQIMESKMEDLHDAPKTRKKVFNVLVECLQNLYHHLDDIEVTGGRGVAERPWKSVFWRLARGVGIERKSGPDLNLVGRRGSDTGQSDLGLVWED